MFTKQHYEAIARIINTQTQGNGAIHKNGLVQALADMFEADNERFNRDKFFTRCYENNPTAKPTGYNA